MIYTPSTIRKCRLKTPAVNPKSPFEIKTFLVLLHTISVSLLVTGLSPSDMNLTFYYGPSFSDSETYELADAAKVLSHPNFTNSETHFFLHGWNEDQTSDSVRLIVEAYSKRKTINLLIADWSVPDQPRNDTVPENPHNIPPEPFVFPFNIYSMEVASQLAEIILGLSAAGLDWERFTVVGHSLGTQLSGIAGREIMRKTNGTLQLYQMVLLDPPFPHFPIVSLPRVNKNDAQFVQVIHTDPGVYGQPFQLGHVDFWPNPGEHGQPGCPKGDFNLFSEEATCSHHRSYKLWAESVATVDGPYFWAFPASKVEEFVSRGVDRDKAIQMGFNCPRGARGNYYLTTNSASPYARGFEGYEFKTKRESQD